jgi:hypothetical protein
MYEHWTPTLSPPRPARRSLLACGWCGRTFESLDVDRRGRLVSGYRLLQEHAERCGTGRHDSGARGSARP